MFRMSDYFQLQRKSGEKDRRDDLYFRAGILLRQDIQNPVLLRNFFCFILPLRLGGSRFKAGDVDVCPYSHSVGSEHGSPGNPSAKPRNTASGGSGAVLLYIDFHNIRRDFSLSDDDGNDVYPVYQSARFSSA